MYDFTTLQEQQPHEPAGSGRPRRESTPGVQDVPAGEPGQALRAKGAVAGQVKAVGVGRFVPALALRLYVCTSFEK